MVKTVKDNVDYVLKMDNESKSAVYALLALERRMQKSRVLKTRRKSTVVKHNRWPEQKKKELYACFSSLEQKNLDMTIDLALTLGKKFSCTSCSIIGQYYKWKQKCQMLELYLDRISVPNE